jgi:hypothetical protein
MNDTNDLGPWHYTLRNRTAWVHWDDGSMTVDVPGEDAEQVVALAVQTLSAALPAGVQILRSGYSSAEDGEPGYGFAATDYGAVPVDDDETGYKVIEAVAATLEALGYKVRSTVEGDE